MNEVGAQRAIKKLIDDYKDVLVDGHYQQGTYRAINEITLSVLTPPRQYYHVKVQVRGAEDMSFVDRNTAKPRRKPVYDCMIHVADPAKASGTYWAEQYELAHTHFRSMVEGIAALVAGSYWASPINGTYYTYFQSLPICIEDPDTNSKFHIVRGGRSDRLIRVQNLDHTWQDPDNEVWTPLMYSTIQFSLEEQIV